MKGQSNQRSSMKRRIKLKSCKQYKEYKEVLNHKTAQRHKLPYRIAARKGC